MDDIASRDSDGGTATSYEALKARVHELKKTHQKVVANQTAAKEVRSLRMEWFHQCDVILIIL